MTFRNRIRHAISFIRQNGLWISGASLLVLAGLIFTVRAADVRQEGTGLGARMQSVEHTLEQSRGVIVNSQPPILDIASQKRAGTLVQSLSTLAAQHGLDVLSVQYRPASKFNISGDTSLEVTAQLRGSYSPAKKLLSDLMADYPSLALDSVKFQRNAATEAVLSIEVRWTLVMKKAA